MFHQQYKISRALSILHVCAVTIFLIIITDNNKVSASLNSEFIKGKICIGTNGRLSMPSDESHHYRNLRDRYTNCTYVDGNLEITSLRNVSFDLSFLQHIREVTGYVLISHVDVSRLVLPRLQIIRGRTLFRLQKDKQEFALLVTLSRMYSLEMPALRDILNGNVGMFGNYNLCHVQKINWDEIITGLNDQYFYGYNFSAPERECPECDRSCEHYCWGEGPENCQKFSKTNCSPQCWQGRCFGPKPRECCHLFCAGGCTGPKQSDCLACKSFYDDGLCTLECPPMQKYNPTTYSWEPNPDGKYAYGATCVRECPQHLLKDNGACVKSCPQKKKAVNRECIPCDGPCPKTCRGVGDVHGGNIDSFKDCTVIDGSIAILDHTFKGIQEFDSNLSAGPKHDPMHPSRLEVFSTVKEITGYLNIQGYHRDFTNLSAFRNLEIIGGRDTVESASLFIVRTALVSLGLSSLKEIMAGSVLIVENYDLCYVQSIKWDNFRKTDDQKYSTVNNRNKTECEKKGLVCDKQCSDEGCWGPGPAQCLSCKNVILGHICLENCSIIPGIYQASDGVCSHCHEECDGGCVGPNAEHCTKCKNIQDGPYCVKTCPVLKYNDNGHCKNCHANCVGGCEGPENKIGVNGCYSCEKAIMNGHVPEGCLQKREPCPEGYYYEWVSPQVQGALKPLAGKGVCRKCHSKCKKCTGYGDHEQVCQQCQKLKRGEHCEDECPSDHYVDNNTQLCKPCFSECRGCIGSEPNQCLKCRNFKVYLDGQPGDNNTAFNCTETCPPDNPHKIYPPDGEPYCYVEAMTTGFLLENELQPAIIGGVGLLMAIFMVIGAVMMCQWRIRTKAKENTVKMTMALTGLDDNEPLHPTGVKPNLAKLRIIKEEDMRKGDILGFGAFGNVYKGIWFCENENMKVPVAIKVLHSGTGANTSKEFLDEAYIMASVEHPNLVKLLAVCMTSQMMLVTQLVPLGCLLDFVRNYKNKIGSKSLLNWSTQIARGMAYLEERRLVHRDLAARNVLVQHPNCVKITDFGLAKLLDINEEHYKAAGGKMPIKWLALECIQHRIFTHKSDVWAFGVTIWEILTYGGKPYDNVPARKVPELLEKGERLPQPIGVSIDVYMILIKCWMLDAESRPTFKELGDEFARMSRDPGRYIAGFKDLTVPLYTAQDNEKEMIRKLASAIDSPETLVDADEYLQPKSRAPIPMGISAASISGSPPNSPIKTFWPNGIASIAADSPTPQNQQNWDRELLRCSANYANESIPSDIENSIGQQPILHTLLNGHCGHSTDPESSNSRFCSDSLQTGGNTRDCDVTDDCFVAESGTTHQQAQARVGSLKLDLPLDEDDYLMPSPQLPTNATQYIDLIGDTKPTELEPKRLIGSYRKYPDFLTIPCKTSLDNPEYIMAQDDGPLTPQTLGIPTSDLNKILTNGAFGVQTRQKCSEEESDHEYYNDFDRLERERQPLKPLRKNETTV